MADKSDADERPAPTLEAVPRARLPGWAITASRRLVEMNRKTHAVALAIAAAILIAILWKVPQWEVRGVRDVATKTQFDAENAARVTLAQILAGIVLLAGGFATWRNLKLAQESHITDRFTKAIEQLGATGADGKKKLEVRVGGIYALERIARDSARDHWTIMEVLCTYVRENAPCVSEESLTQPAPVAAPEESPANTVSGPDPHPPADIQAILTVLRRRNRKQEGEDERLDLHGTQLRGADLNKANLGMTNLSKADLSRANLIWSMLSGAEFNFATLNRATFIRADLSGAMLWGAKLIRANLSEANLSRASLVGAKLSEADLGRADLSRADLGGADLVGAFLVGANLGRAHLYGADLSGANLFGADLGGALLGGTLPGGALLVGPNLAGADLSGAKNLTQGQIEAARGDSNTKLPDYLSTPESWKK